jgi:hypothetical protein
MQGGPCPDRIREGGETPADRRFCRSIFSTSRMFAAAARVARCPARGFVSRVRITESIFKGLRFGSVFI